MRRWCTPSYEVEEPETKPQIITTTSTSIPDRLLSQRTRPRQTPPLCHAMPMAIIPLKRTQKSEFEGAIRTMACDHFKFSKFAGERDPQVGFWIRHLQFKEQRTHCTLLHKHHGQPQQKQTRSLPRNDWSFRVLHRSDTALLTLGSRRRTNHCLAPAKPAREVQKVKVFFVFLFCFVLFLRSYGF